MRRAPGDAARAEAGPAPSEPRPAAKARGPMRLPVPKAKPSAAKPRPPPRGEVELPVAGVEAAFAEALQRELREQRRLLRRVAEGEIPALRMEIAFLRADLHTLEEKVLVGSGDSRGSSSAASELLTLDPADEDEGFERSALEIPPAGGSDSSSDLPLREVSRRGAHGPLTSMGARSSLRTELVVVDALEQGRTVSMPDHREDSSGSEVAHRPTRPRGRNLLALSLEPNIWDCAVMCALFGWHKQSFGKFNVVLTNLLLVINVIAQGLFVMIMASIITGDAYEKEAMLSYRLLVGHAFDQVDSRSFATRMEQVCGQKWYDQLGITLADLEEYILEPEEDRQFWMISGRVVCLLAMFTWIVSIYSEFRRLSEDLLLVIMALPVTHEVETEARGGFSVVTGTRRLHKAYCMAILFSRAVIALGLLVFGLIFLVHTKEVSDLLTNCVALEFVRRIDELIFEAIVPRKLMGCVKVVKIVISGRRYLPHESAGGKMTCRGYVSPKQAGKSRGVPLQNYWVLVRLVFVTGTLLLFYFFSLQPLVQESKSVYNTLCGSHLDFVYQPHPVTGMPVFASMNPYTKSTPNEPVQVNEIGSLRCFYAASYEMLRMRAGFDPMYSTIDNVTIWTLVNGSDPVCTPKDFGGWTPCLERDLRYISALSLLSWSQFFQDPYWCKDQDVSIAILSSTCLNKSSFLGKSPELIFFKDVRSCRDFKPSCRETRGNLKVTVAWQDKISKLCPVTCGVCQ